MVDIVKWESDWSGGGLRWTQHGKAWVVWYCGKSGMAPGAEIDLEYAHRKYEMQIYDFLAIPGLSRESSTNKHNGTFVVQFYGFSSENKKVVGK